MDHIQEYKIIGKVTENKGSVVYRGQKEGDQTTFIINVLKTQSPTPSDIARFKQEYSIIQKINLGSVIKTIEIINERESYAIVQEYFDADVLKGQQFDIKTFLKVAIQLADTLGHLHLKDIIHKDIRPDNIYINKNGKVKITNFGASFLLTRENKELYDPHVITNILPYISPEQTGRMNCDVDYRTDLYSLGITFYEMLTGKVPFTSNNPMEIIHSHIAKMPLALSVKKPVSDIIIKLLSKNAHERYQNAFGLKTDLEKCLQQFNEKGTILPFELGKNDISKRFIIPQKLFGREKEINELVFAYERVTKGGQGLVVVSGSPGIGKSALINEIHKPVIEKKGYFIAGKYDQFRRDVPYSAIIQAFQGMIRQILIESEDKVQKWKDEILETLGPNTGVLSKIIPEIEVIIGKQLEVQQLGPEEERNRFNLVFQNFISVFTKKEHPIALFLDDLQWADFASLQLIQNLILNSEIKYLFVIGVYRDNEVNDLHPLVHILDEIKSKKERIDNIELKPLIEKNVSDLIKNFLNCSTEKADSLGRIIHSKTYGNPFFVRQFLKNLYDEKLIIFDGLSGWCWDEDKIDQMKVTENVVDLLSEKMKKLSALSQEIIKLCACIGNRFDVETLSLLLNKPIEKVLYDITELVNEGFIRITDKYYLFQHDKIYEAAYSLIPENEKGPLHYIIGKFELGRTDEKELQNKLLYIVDHLNLGQEMIIDEDRKELLKLNLGAGKKAKASAAYIPANKYFNFAIDLLEEDYWTSDYCQALEIYNESVEVAFLKGDYDEMNRLSEIIIKNSETVFDIVKVYIIRMKAYRSQQNFVAATKTGLEALNTLGYNLPLKPTKMDFLLNLVHVKFLLIGKDIEKLDDMPMMTDKRILLIDFILSDLVIVAYFASPYLYGLVALKQMQLYIKYGFARRHAYTLGAFGIVSVGVLDDIDTGYKVGRLMLKLLEIHDIKEEFFRVINSYNLFFRHWKEHLKVTLLDYKRAFQSALEAGGIEYCALNLLMYDLNKLLLGADLNNLEKEIQKHNQVILNLKQEHMRGLLCIVWQMIINLHAGSDDPTRLSGTALNAEKSLQDWNENDTRTSLALYYYLGFRLCYLFNEMSRGIEFQEKADEHMETLIGTAMYRDFTYYKILFMLTLYPKLSHKDQKRILKKTKSILKKAKKYSGYCSENNLHWVHLIEAERANVLGKDSIASEHYRHATELSKNHEYLSDEALANELAGKFYLSRGYEKVAWVYMQEAYKCYSRWGAKAKLKHLEETYPELIIKPRDESRVSMPSLDVGTVMKASQAISSEIELNKLLTQMMLITVENAGAEKGFLILENKGKLFVEAEIKKGEEPILKSKSVEEYNGFSLAIVRFVARTKDTVILDNAAVKGDFIRDEYVRKHQPKSIICAPILKKGKVSAVLYLENNLADGAFTKERIEVIQVLTSQAAISFENAKLYEEVQESEEKYRTILESIEDGYFESDLDGNITFLNDSMIRIFGYDRNDLMGSNFQEYIDRENVRKISQATGNVYLSGAPVKGLEFVAKRKDGSEIYVDYAASLRRNSDGKPIGFRGILRDITEKKRVERLKHERDVAKETAEAKSAFLSNMSHEIRTPLNAIMGFSKSMMKTDMTGAQKYNMDRIGQSSNHLMDIVNSILDLSKMEAGKFELEAVNFSLREIMKELEVMFSGIIPESVQLKINIDESIPVNLIGDALKIKQILINLINNAKKFTKDGSITVNISLDELLMHDNVKLGFLVQDTGIGIPQDRLTDLFSPYTQADKSTARKFGGTGIGLTISKGFVEMMGGKIWAESEEGIGTTFYFTINLTQAHDSPVKTEVDTPKIEEHAIESPPVDLKGLKVLLAEDEIINQELAVTLLGYMGVEVTCVSNGKEAVDAVNTYQYDAVFMDMQMPVMDGIEATQTIKKNPKHKTLPVIAMTGNASSEDREKCIKSGMVDVVPKPIDEDNLFSVLSTAIASATDRKTA